MTTVIGPIALALLTSFWSDGKAELSTYELIQPRYDELHYGKVVLIFVKEPFSKSQRLKVQKGDVDVLKLNVVKDFQTGIYDYNLMTSVFAPFSGAPLKLTFTSQEWCGMMAEELIVDLGKIRRSRQTYFEHDEIKEDDSFPDGGIFADQLPLIVRGFPKPLLKKGEKKTVTLLHSLERSRLLHFVAKWTEGEISRSTGWYAIQVDAGRFEVERWTATFADEAYVFAVERAFPHRIIQWSGPQGERASLVATQRMAYWLLNRKGDDKHLPSLGL